MSEISSKKIYIDMNVYNKILSDNDIRKKFYELKDTNKFFFSPAHVEEVYLSKVNCTNDIYLENIKKRINLIKDLTNNTALHPNFKKPIYEFKNAFDTLMFNVESYPTDKIIENLSISKVKHEKDDFKKLLNNNKEMKNLSNRSETEIWKIEHVSNSLKIRKLIFGPLGFNLNPKSFNYIKSDFRSLEFSVSALFDTLTGCGYVMEKDNKTAISSTHDISHAIYATYCDFLISTDKKFIKKCKAVYSYLGVPTKVLKFDDFVNNYLHIY